MAKQQPATEKDVLLSFFRKFRVLRPRDLTRLNVSRQALRRLVEAGTLERVGRGLYRAKGAPADEHASIAEACKAVPAGVVCLLSALRLHNLTTQSPFEVWLAIPVKAHLPRTGLPIRFARFSGAALSGGIETRLLEGVKVKVYRPAKTVADCFKYRNKIGIDVAREALRECLREGKATRDELWRYAKICRVTNVMRPYLETAGA
jgi:predicted transcriptional regulator of viral defense system